MHIHLPKNSWEAETHPNLPKYAYDHSKDNKILIYLLVNIHIISQYIIVRLKDDFDN